MIEVVIALTLLGMIIGTLFAIIQGSVRAASQIEQLQRENDAVNRLFEILRRTFSTLPSPATLTLTLVDQNASELQELMIVGAPNSFSFGIKPISYSEAILGLRPDHAGRTDEQGRLLQTLSLSRDDLIPETEDNQMALGQDLGGALAQDEQGRVWMPLLPEVSSLKWRFYKLSELQWYEEWTEATWPDLVELQLVMRDRAMPLRAVFGVPTLTLTPGRPAKPTAGTSTGSQPSPQQGGGR